MWDTRAPAARVSGVDVEERAPVGGGAGFAIRRGD